MHRSLDGCVMGETSRNLVLLANVVKNYRSASLLSCKQGLLVIHSHRREWALPRLRRKARARVARKGVVRARERSFVVRTYIVVRMGEGEEVTY